MKNWGMVFLLGLLSFPGSGAAESPKGTEIIMIPSDNPPPPEAAEQVAPIHPFFTDTTPGRVEAIEDLEARVQSLEKRVKALEAAQMKEED